MTREFATTSGTSCSLHATEAKVARLALGSLCEAYWFPLYAYVRHRGHAADEARDLTQAFFADLLSRDFLSAIDRSKGRFRSFLLASLEHFLSHERDKARALRWVCEPDGGRQPPAGAERRCSRRGAAERRPWRQIARLVAAARCAQYLWRPFARRTSRGDLGQKIQRKSLAR